MVTTRSSSGHHSKLEAASLLNMHKKQAAAHFQLLTNPNQQPKIHDCIVPIDKHNSVLKKLAHPLTLRYVKSQFLQRLSHLALF